MDTSADPIDLRRALARAERLLGCFQTAVAHDLPNQLVALQGLLRMLQADAANRLDADGHELLMRLVVLSQRSHALVHELAELGRLGREPPAADGIDLAEVVREATAEVKQLCSGQPIEYHCAVEGGHSLRVPYRALRQVLLLLLRHAAQRAGQDHPLRVEIGARRTPGGLVWWVADDGVGLPPERQARLFEPFAAADPPLGLFPVRHAVEGWGGTVGVTSAPGRGCTITVSLEAAIP